MNIAFRSSLWVVCIFSIFSNSVNSFAAELTAQKLVEAVTKKIDVVKDYTADVQLKLDVEFVKAPEATGKLYFKKPNKFRMKSEGFAMLPKQGFDIAPLGLLQNKEFTAIDAGKATVGTTLCTVVKVIPTSSNSDVVLSVLYIDPASLLILKSETTTKKNGTLTMVLQYADGKAYGLPSQMTITFDVSEFKLPKSVSGDINGGDNKPKTPRRSTGSVQIKVWNYIINKGVDESVFR